MLFVGVTALGAARFFHARPGGLSFIGIGVVGLALVRPHIAVLLVAALLAAQLFRPAGGTASGYLSKVVGIAVLAAAAVVLTLASAEFLGIDDFSSQAVSERVEWSGGQTAQGGSEFTAVDLSSPLGIPWAFITVLFRPFPFEAHNVQLLFQSLEGMFLLGLTIAGWRRLRQIPRMLRSNPFLWFVLLYVIGFVLAFAGFANFGILARQRVLMLPFFLMLLSLPRPTAPLFASLPLRPGETGVDAGEDRRMMTARR